MTAAIRDMIRQFKDCSAERDSLSLEVKKLVGETQDLKQVFQDVKQALAKHLKVIDPLPPRFMENLVRKLLQRRKFLCKYFKVHFYSFRRLSVKMRSIQPWIYKS